MQKVREAQVETGTSEGTVAKFPVSHLFHYIYQQVSRYELKTPEDFLDPFKEICRVKSIFITLLRL